VQITTTSSESLVLAQTDAGRIWATWTLNKRVYLAQTSGSADAPTVTFNAAFVPSMGNLAAAESTAATTLVSDDISTIASANGVTTLVWSNQVTGTVWSARRTDAGSTWNAVPVVSGALMADDHVNLRAIPGDPAGRLALVLKTSRNDTTLPVQSDPLLMAAVYSPASGTWATSTVATVAESGTRPMVVVEPATDELHVFYTGPTTAGAVAYEGTVYGKTASLSTLQFPSSGTPVLRNVASATMNNATSAKLPATAASGVAVLGATESAPRYWWSVDGGAVLPPAPTAAFTASATSGTAPLAVSFTDTSTGTPTSWAWTFGDGGTSSAQNPSHTFTSAGTYPVTLTATNAGGSTSTSTTVTVTDPVVQAPTASFTPSTSSGTTPLAVSFTDTSTGSPTSWSWTFGDGGTSSAQSPSYTFTSAGTYTVTLTASNSAGSTSASTTITVTDPVVVTPTASFTASRTSGTTPVQVSFTDTSTGAPTSWSWTFGDGGTSSAQSPSHTFTSAGTYTVTLTASNSAGSTSASTTITVIDPVAPTASFTASATSGTAPLAVSFTDTSTGSPTSWFWSFGDGGTSTAQNPSHTFTTAGTYTVTLTASTVGGSTSASRTVVVTAPVTGIPIDRVNAGGAAVAGGWLADTAAAPSAWVNARATKLGVATTTAAINLSDPSIPSGTPASLFQTSRYDLSGGKNMIWTMPVPSPGTYRVRLYFAETYWTAAGKRAFDVTINSTKVLTRFDIYAAAGGNRRGIVKEFTVTSATGSPLVITFGRISGLDNPQVNAIEVLS
jgi:PKD repeat protein